jgi:hypothetical protein
MKQLPYRLLSPTAFLTAALSLYVLTACKNDAPVGGPNRSYSSPHLSVIVKSDYYKIGNWHTNGMNFIKSVYDTNASYAQDEPSSSQAVEGFAEDYCRDSIADSIYVPACDLVDTAYGLWVTSGSDSMFMLTHFLNTYRGSQLLLDSISAAEWKYVDSVTNWCLALSSSGTWTQKCQAASARVNNWIGQFNAETWSSGEGSYAAGVLYIMESSVQYAQNIRPDTNMHPKLENVIQADAAGYLIGYAVECYKEWQNNEFTKENQSKRIGAGVEAAMWMSLGEAWPAIKAFIGKKF